MLATDPATVPNPKQAVSTAIVPTPAVAIQPDASAPAEHSATPATPSRTRAAAVQKPAPKDRLESAYAAYDARLQPGTPAPPWAAARDFYADVAYADPTASIRSVACSDDFCRIDIQRQNDGKRSSEMTRKLATQVKAGEAVMFRYGRDGALAMYVINTSIREALEPTTN